MTNRSRYALSSDPATSAALRRAGVARSAAAVGIVALLLAAAAGTGFGGKEPAHAVDTPSVADHVTTVRDRPEAAGSQFEDEFRLDPRELRDYRSNVHG